MKFYDFGGIFILGLALGYAVSVAQPYVANLF